MVCMPSQVPCRARLSGKASFALSWEGQELSINERSTMYLHGSSLSPALGEVNVTLIRSSKAPVLNAAVDDHLGLPSCIRRLPY